MSNNTINKLIAQRLISRFPNLYIIYNGKKTGFKNALINIRGYNAIKENHLLDEDYYLINNIDVKLSGMDPVIHYLFHGFKESRSPHPEFDANYYFNKYSDVKKSNLNPLVHYSLYGIKEKRKIKKFIPKILESIHYSHYQINNILNALNNNKKISIIIPIDNQLEEVKECINSVLKNTRIPYEMILIDNFSPDKRIRILLDELGKIPNVKVIRNQENKLLENINIQIQNSYGDVVLLSSKTQVSAKWLQKLVVAAYSNEKIGIVNPLTNTEGLFSVPEINKEQIESLSIEDMATLLEKISDNEDLEVPICNDFCMYIKRETITNVGLLKNENIYKGYEKVDFCIRALEKSWKNILDDSTYIYKRSTPILTKHEKKKMDSAITHRNYHSNNERVEKFLNDKKYEELCYKAKNRLIKSTISESNKKRILYVLHSSKGGTPATNIDLMANIQKKLDCYVLTSNTVKIKLWRYKNSIFEEIYSWKIKSKWSAKDFHNLEFRNIYFNVLNGLKIDIIHIRHLIKHTFDLYYLAKSLGLPVIISFHDFYFICPSHNLLDENNVYCAGKCTDGHEQCLIGSEFSDLPLLKLFVNEWRIAVADILYSSSALVTTSELTKQLYMSIYPGLSKKEFRIIEHGRDFEKVDDTSKFYEIPSKDKPIKILFPGNINIVKGSELIKKIKILDKNSRLEFHFIGSLYLHSKDLENYGIYHGPYERENFCEMVKKIKPSFIGIFSIWPETYCHTLSEAWSCGVPVLTSKIGVLEERVNNNGGGWLLDYKNPIRVYNEIIRISESNDEYVEVAEQVKKISFKSTKDMAQEYLDLYCQFLDC